MRWFLIAGINVNRFNNQHRTDSLPCKLMRTTEGLRVGFRNRWMGGLQKLITVWGRFDTYKGEVRVGGCDGRAYYLLQYIYFPCKKFDIENKKKL